MRGFVKDWFNLVSSQSRDLLFSETCWVNAISRSKYCENGVSAKVALTIFNDTMWVKSFLMLVLNSTGSKMVLEIRSNTFAFLTAMKCNRVFCYFFFIIATKHIVCLLLQISNICRLFTFRCVSVIERLICKKSTTFLKYIWYYTQLEQYSMHTFSRNSSIGLSVWYLVRYGWLKQVAISHKLYWDLVKTS